MRALVPKIHLQVTFFSDYTKLYLFNWLFTSESKGEFNIRSGVTSEEPYLHIQSAPPNNHGKKNSFVPSVFLDIDITQVIKITYRYGLDDCGASLGRPV